MNAVSRVAILLATVAILATSQAAVDLPHMGAFPISLPRCDGVEQLLVLSNRWVIVVTRNIEDVVAAIDDLSGGALLKAEDDWERSQAAGRPNWKAYKDRSRIRDQFIAAARERAGERRLDEPSFFSITSQTDARYLRSLHPSRCTRNLVPIGGKRVRGSHDIDYAHYCYLELPHPLEDGASYTIRLGNGKQVTFLYDELRTVSRAIKVNQVGYLPDAGGKYAYLGCCLFEFGPMQFPGVNEFRLVDVGTGEIAFRGPVRHRATNARYAPRPGRNESPDSRPLMSGEAVYELDFSPVRKEGEYFISIPGVGRSWPFRVAGDVYGEVFFTAMRGMFHQRASFALQRPFTAWTRPRYHTTPVYECDLIPGPKHGGGPAQKKYPGARRYDRFDIVGGSIDRARKTEDVDGGWYDAADWDRNFNHYTNVLDMLAAYEFGPRKFTDGQLFIPESGNGIPDILDEAEYGLRVWKRSQTPDGGVSGFLETWTHPPIDGDVDYAFARRTRWDSLLYAGAAAQLAQNLQPCAPELAQQYADSAVRAYRYGVDPAHALRNVVIHARANRGKGEPYALRWSETDDCITPYLIFAKLRLFSLTHQRDYLKGLDELCRKTHPPFFWRFSHRDFSPWLYFGFLRGPALVELPSSLLAFWRDMYFSPSTPVGSGMDSRAFVPERLVKWARQMPYRHSSPPVRGELMGWGWLITTNFNRPLAIAHSLTGEARYRDAMLWNADFVLGANPMGMCWTTGLGFTYPVHFQHAFSEGDGIADPVPGITVYGVTTGPRFYQFRRMVWESPTTTGEPVHFIREANTRIPVLRRWGAHPTLNTAKCEFTIHETMSSVLLTAAVLMPENWLPSDELKHRQPRDESLLFGQWYLP